MTNLLEKALECVRQLPEAEQDVIAALILAELEDDRRWDEAFAGSPETLAELLAEAEDISAVLLFAERNPDHLMSAV